MIKPNSYLSVIFKYMCLKTVVNLFTAVAVLLVFTVLTGCKKGLDDKKVKLFDRDTFVKRRNSDIAKWIDEQIKVHENDCETHRTALSNATTAEEKKRNTQKLNDSERQLAKFTYRKSLGDYLAIRKIEDLPEGLQWEDGMSEPPIGDPKAKKGGSFTTAISAFPATLRPFGPESNHFFRGKLYDDLSIGLISIHPVTENPIPGVAHQWAKGKDGRTVFYKINPKATYTDGVPIKAMDFITNIYVRTSDNVTSPYAKRYYKDSIAQIAVYDDYTLSVSIPEQSPFLMSKTSMSPAPSHFYSEYGPDYKTRYQWRVPPSTGAYFVKPEDIKKGRSITLTRYKEWWAEKRYFGNVYNADRLRYIIVRDRSKQFELFKLGEIDAFHIHSPEHWYDKMEVPAVFDGYIEKTRFYHQYPLIPWGIYINVDEGILKDKNVRLGIQHAMNFQKVNDQMFRGDYVRLNQFVDGYGRYTNSDVKARPYNAVLAREYFTKAGFTQEKDGVLYKKDGTKLSFSCTIRQDPSRERMLQILKNEARNAGLELKVDALETSVSFAKTSKKEHDSTYGGWYVSPGVPSMRQFFHSENAFDEQGNRKANTNNQTSYANDSVDILVDEVRYGRTKDDIEKAAREAQQIIHDDAIFVPAVARNFAAIGSWRWMQWPDCKEVTYCYPNYDDPLISHLWWIDTDIKKETQQSRRDKITYPEVEKVIIRYRDGGERYRSWSGSSCG